MAPMILKPQTASGFTVDQLTQMPLQTVGDFLHDPHLLLRLPDDANPALAYPAFMLKGTLPPHAPQFSLNIWNRLNALATPIATLFGRRQGSIGGP